MVLASIICLRNRGSGLAFKISEVFELVFGTANSVVACKYDERRWFRYKPPLPDRFEADDSDETHGPVSDIDDEEMQDALVSDIDEADSLLKAKVLASAVGWVDADHNASAIFDTRIHLPPRTPYDVFAIAAYIVEQSGIYHHLQPVKRLIKSGMKAEPDASKRHISIEESDRQIVTHTAEAWRNLDVDTPSMRSLALSMTDKGVWKGLEPLFESWWIIFGCNGNHLIGERPEEQGQAIVPVWWKHAWRLLAIADEAARGTAFNFDIDAMNKLLDNQQTHMVWFEGDVMIELAGAALMQFANDEKEGQARFSDIHSLSVANPSVVNVLPKVRTPSVGCTLRSVSHHLALLPPAGVVRGRWTPNYTQKAAVPGAMPNNTMNLVLIPLPYSLNAKCFVPSEVEDLTNGPENAKPRTGYFEVEPTWLSNSAKVLKFIACVINNARERADDIHGLVFPELALTYKLFDEVRNLVKRELPGAEILIAGISTNASGASGNFVATSTFKQQTGTPVVRETIREKHHRWKLDATQLRDYGLLGALSPELDWWENIDLSSRQVDFTVMRRDSVFAAMICEDLARVDPCQQMIRAIGPNLVVALLMDAPQVEARWPARYATVLAEDPGCAVLTLTSRGLMTLQHQIGTYRSSGQDRIIALWRDDSASRPTTIDCPYDAQAVILTITAGQSKDVALDGRVDNDAKAWRYAGHMPIRVPNAKKEFSAVLGDEDMASW